MKVNGQLEVAQLEQIANASPTPTPTGRVYADITVPTAAVPRFFNGSAWVPIALGQATSVISQNSGLAVTVNWATGLNQMVVLTNNCVISFQNPVPGSVHTLIIQQSASNSWRFNFNMIDQATKRQPYQPIGVIPQNGEASYSWFYSAGVQAAITTLGSAYAAPATLPPTSSTNIDVSPDGKTLLMNRSTTPFFVTYDLTDAWPNGLAPLGLQNITTPTAAAGTTTGFNYLPDNKSVLTSNGTTPFIQLFLTNRGTPVTAIANPVTLPPNTTLGSGAHPSGFFVGVGHSTTPFMSIYPNKGGSFGTKLTDPVTLPAAQVYGLQWSPQGDYLTVLTQVSPFIQTWAFTYTGSGTGAIGTVSANPGTLPVSGNSGSNGSRYVAWRPQGDWIACALTTSPFLYVVPFNRTTGTYGTALTVTALSNAANSVAWSPDGQFLIVGAQSAPFLYIYDFSAGNLATPVTISVSPGVVIGDICVHPNGETLFLALGSSPFIISYQMPTKVRNYLRLTGP